MEYPIAFMIAFAFIIFKVTKVYKNSSSGDEKSTKSISVLDFYESNSVFIREYTIPKKNFIDVSNLDFDF